MSFVLSNSNRQIRPNMARYSTSSFGPNPKDRKRREKVNKYRNKSEQNKDPLELLMEESESKIKELKDQEEKSKAPKNANMEKIEALKNIPRRFVFPDNKYIDPNDPASFGFIEIGTVVGAHGVHGEIKVKSSSGFPRR